eukprot:scaffold7625_cov249-Chaetoceros_neogracile.AAC.1
MRLLHLESNCVKSLAIAAHGLLGGKYAKVASPLPEGLALEVNAGVVAMHHFQSKRSQQGICTAWAKGVDKISLRTLLTNTMKKGADQNKNSGFDTD